MTNSNKLIHKELNGNSVWSRNSNCLHHLSSRIKGNLWNSPLLKRNILVLLNNHIFKDGSDMWEFDNPLEGLFPEIGKVFPVVNGIFHHKLASECPDGNKVEFEFELSSLFGTK